MPEPANRLRQYAYLESVAASRRRFPNALRIGDTVYVSSQPPVSVRAPSPADIRDQTHSAFRDFVDLLGAVGVRMADLVKLHTFYVYDGRGDATAFWERMTEVRLQYFANPGPCGTALRVKGAPVHDRLIAIDGVASSSAARRRLMPAHAWDWSMPTPLSQGWRIGDVVYAGGQISADRRGRAVAPDDLAQQTINTMEFLRHVFLEAGAGFEHVVALKIGYQHRGDERAARAVLDAILGIVRPMFAPGQCVLTCLGIDLLYDGLQLEIDATAVVDAPAQRRVTGAGVDWCGGEGFATACRVGAHVFIGGISAPGRATIAEQLGGCIDRLDATLCEIGSNLVDAVKLNVLFCAEASAELANAASIDEVLRERLPMPGPVVTIVRVAGLPHAEQLVQIDAVAMIDRGE
jgi:enamine deaminase RidA (YjgF/YER057c/UK114 family)